MSIELTWPIKDSINPNLTQSIINLLCVHMVPSSSHCVHAAGKLYSQLRISDATDSLIASPTI